MYFEPTNQRPRRSCCQGRAGCGSGTPQCRTRASDRGSPTASVAGCSGNCLGSAGSTRSLGQALGVERIDSASALHRSVNSSPPESQQGPTVDWGPTGAGSRLEFAERSGPVELGDTPFQSCAGVVLPPTPDLSTGEGEMCNYLRCTKFKYKGRSGYIQAGDECMEICTTLLGWAYWGYAKEQWQRKCLNVCGSCFEGN